MLPVDNSDFQILVTKIHGLYGPKFPGLLPDMAKFWFERIRHLEEDTAEHALYRWASQHTMHPPSLDELLEQAEYVREDQQRAKRQGSSTKSFLDVLKDAADAQASNPLRSPDDVTYGRLMATLAERSIDRWQDKQGRWHEKLTHEQRGEQCYAWAEHYQTTRPELARDLQAAARKFAETLYTPQASS